MVLLILVLRLVPILRQRAYGRVSAGETVRLVVALPARAAADAGLGVELIRALHPRARCGFDGWRGGSREWTEFLGSGGGEDLSQPLR